jgi:hypothetical protein
MNRYGRAMTTDPRAALDRLIAALEAHLQAASRRLGEADPAVVAVYQTLADAFESYDEALYTAYDEVTPFVLYEGEDDDDGDDEDGDDEDGDDEDGDDEDDDEEDLDDVLGSVIDDVEDDDLDEEDDGEEVDGDGEEVDGEEDLDDELLEVGAAANAEGTTTPSRH